MERPMCIELLVDLINKILNFLLLISKIKINYIVDLINKILNFEVLILKIKINYILNVILIKDDIIHAWKQ